MNRCTGILAALLLSCPGLRAETPSLPEAQAAFEKADADLNEAWAEARAKLPEGAFLPLKDEQRAWVEYRDYLASSGSYTGVMANENGRTDTVAYFEAAADLTESRTLWLRGLVTPVPGDASLTGLWIDSYGGNLEVVENGGQLHFLIEVVRGPTVHTGAIAGLARWNQPIGWFSDKGREDDKDDETNLSFILRNNQLEIVGATTEWYHGLRAYFDGRYVRIRDLTSDQQLRVMKAAVSGEVPEGE